jgi:hypothetical protein
VLKKVFGIFHELNLGGGTGLQAGETMVAKKWALAPGISFPPMDIGDSSKTSRG